MNKIGANSGSEEFRAGLYFPLFAWASFSPSRWMGVDILTQGCLSAKYADKKIISNNFNGSEG
jgi:hypothetical protein